MGSMGSVALRSPVKAEMGSMVGIIGWALVVGAFRTGSNTSATAMKPDRKFRQVDCLTSWSRLIVSLTQSCSDRGS